MAKIYTRGGDGGSTGLFDGTRVPKDHARCEAYGDVDELHAVVGLARAVAAEKRVADALPDIQKDLMAVGAQLADPKAASRPPKEKTVISEDRIEEFEKMIDEFQPDLPPLKGFILRGGTQAGACLHLACTVCRRAERRIVTLGRDTPVLPIVLKYVNRLSDLLFVLARLENRADGETQW